MATRTMTATPAAPGRAFRYPTDEELEALSKIYPPSDEFFPPSEQYMGESHLHGLRLSEFIHTLRLALKGMNDAIIATDVNLYYRQGSPPAVLAPDAMVIFHERATQVEIGKSYFMWAWGKPPDFVMEFGSETTADRDLNEKRDLFADIGVPEYWMFDPHGTDYYGFRLRGERLVDGAYEQIPMYETEDGWLCARSEVLGYDICWSGTELRLRDSETGIPVPTHEESEARADAAEARAREAEAELARLKEQLGL